MERLVRLAAVLKVAGKGGVSAAKLVTVAGFQGDNAEDQLERDLRYLRQQGWQIDTVSGPGEPGHYRMVTVDNRLRVRLTPAQQRALQRAVLLADRQDLVERLGLPQAHKPADVAAVAPLSGHDERLSTALRAVRHRSKLRFRYAGKPRVVHAESVRSQNEQWYLRGLEEGADVVKVFVVTRMSDVQWDSPGTAERVPPTERLNLHPMRWAVDPAVEVTVRTGPQYQPDVERWLGVPDAVDETSDVVELRYTVTNRAALRTRLYQLGRRVELVGPAELRDELVDELATAAGEHR